jgi:hypothetical protein
VNAGAHISEMNRKYQSYLPARQPCAVSVR